MRFLLYFTFFLSLSVIASGANPEIPLTQWGTPEGLELSQGNNGTMQLHMTAFDSAVWLKNANIDPRNVNCIDIRYRSSHLPSFTCGQLFWAEGQYLTNDQYFPIGQLRADGEWHTLRLVADEETLGKELFSRWQHTERIQTFRLDMMDQFPGTIEIASIQFSQLDNSATPGDAFEKYRIPRSALHFENEKLILDLNLPQTDFTVWVKLSELPSSDQMIPVMISGLTNTADLPVLNRRDGIWKYIGTFSGGAVSLASMPDTPWEEILFTTTPDGTPSEYAQRPAWPAINSEIPLLPTDERPRHIPYWEGMMLRHPEDNGTGTFLCRKEFEVSELPIKAVVQICADDFFTLYLNGKEILESHVPDGWKTPRLLDISDRIQSGRNQLAVEYENAVGAGGILIQVDLLFADGKQQKISSNSSWRGIKKGTEDPSWTSLTYDESNWVPMVEQLPPPNFPWSVEVPFTDIFPRQKITSVTAPRQLQGKRGELLEWEEVFSGTVPTNELYGFYELHTKSGHLVRQGSFTAAPLPGAHSDHWSIHLSVPLPEYLSTSEYRLRYELANYHKTPDNEISIRLFDTPVPPPTLKAEIHTKGNYPALYLNGEPEYWMMGDSFFRPLDSGFEQVPMPFRGVWTDNTRPELAWWLGENKYDFSEVEIRLEELLQQSPDVKFILFPSLRPGVWFRNQYPEEESCFEDGSLFHYNSTPSYASDIFRDQAEKALQAFVEHFEKSRFANSIAGYNIAGGFDGEWHGWACHQSAELGKMMDYSNPMKREFARFAKEYYGIESAAIPTTRQRLQRDLGQFLLPDSSLLNIIFTQFNSHVITDMLLDFAAVAKSACNRKKIVGTYNGYTLEYSNMGWTVQMGGSQEFYRLLASADLDFFLSPQSYGLRALGDCGEGMKPVRAIQLSNKLSATEDDTRTFMLPDVKGFFQTVNAQTNRDELRRNMGRALCRGEGIVYFPINRGDEFGNQENVDDMRTFLSAGRFAVRNPEIVRNNSEVAVVVDDASIRFLAYENEYVFSEQLPVYNPLGQPGTMSRNMLRLTGELLYLQRSRLARMGAPYDYISYADISRTMHQYKLWIFLNCFEFDDQLRQNIELLRKNDVTIVYLYAPGFFYNGQASVENMNQLTGFNFGVKSEKHSPIIVPVDFADTPLRNLEEPLMGTQDQLAPLFFVDDPNAAVWGRYQDGNEAAMAMKQTGNATSIFYGAPHLPASLFRNLARAAGVHLYSESLDVFYANSSFITFHARVPGKKRISLPEKADVVDLFSGEVIATQAQEFSFDIQLNETRVFFVGGKKTF